MLLSPGDGTHLVKRVIGIPGDQIALHQNRLSLNGNPISYSAPVAELGTTVAELYRPHAVFAAEKLPGHAHPIMGLSRLGKAPRNFIPITVPHGQYFIMGDSRDNSIDSRAWGFAPRDVILGQARGIIVSLDINDTDRPRWNRWGCRLR